eukprot:TRINITY_DN21193_c0_g3_i1.p1 TRINITY_DN21193_c0_g3~~TRINITY_DN21193_c0_g3_i1.p1  ORF type:complete len:314 (+),score=39.83 TRINITY_DN21193_c0_g3_i1:78-1019(+)
MDVRVLFVSGDERTYFLQDGSRVENLLDALALDYKTVAEHFRLLDVVSGDEIKDVSAQIQFNDCDDAEKCLPTGRVGCYSWHSVYEDVISSAMLTLGSLFIGPAGGVVRKKEKHLPTYTVVWKDLKDVVLLRACKALQSSSLDANERVDRVRDCLDELVDHREDKSSDIKSLLEHLFVCNTEMTVERKSLDMTAKDWSNWFAQRISLSHEQYKVTKKASSGSSILEMFGNSPIHYLLDSLREEPIGVRNVSQSWNHNDNVSAYEIKVLNRKVLFYFKVLVVWGTDVFVTKDGRQGSDKKDWLVFDLRRGAKKR